MGAGDIGGGVFGFGGGVLVLKRVSGNWGECERDCACFGKFSVRWYGVDTDQFRWEYLAVKERV